MTASYGPRRWTDRHLALVTAGLTVGIWSDASNTPTRLVVGGLLGLMAMRSADAPVALVVVVAFLGGTLLGGRAWAATEPRTLGPFAGWATVVEDPVTIGPGTRIVLEIDGERFEAAAYGSKRHRLAALEAGQM